MPTYTATAHLKSHSARLAASATFATNTAVATLVAGSPTLSAVAVTFTAAAAAALSSQPAALSAQATFDNACNFGISIVADCGQAIYGLTEPFKINPCIAGIRNRGRNRILHLDKAKPCMVTATGVFASIYSGTHFPAGEFFYRHPSHVWEFLNLTAVSGLLPDNSDSPAIPIAPLTQVDRDTVFASFMNPLRYTD